MRRILRNSIVLHETIHKIIKWILNHLQKILTHSLIRNCQKTQKEDSRFQSSFSKMCSDLFDRTNCENFVKFKTEMSNSLIENILAQSEQKHKFAYTVSEKNACYFTCYSRKSSSTKVCTSTL